VSLSEYVKAARAYDMNHLLAVHKTSKATFLRLMSLPRGPTFNFKIVHFATCSLLSARLGQ
jgi:hypothetical protein